MCNYAPLYIHMSWLNLSLLNPTVPCCIVTNLYLSPPATRNWPSQKAVHHQPTARPVMLHLELITLRTPADRLSWPQTLLSSLWDMKAVPAPRVGRSGGCLGCHHVEGAPRWQEKKNKIQIWTCFTITGTPPIRYFFFTKNMFFWFCAAPDPLSDSTTQKNKRNTIIISSSIQGEKRLACSGMGTGVKAEEGRWWKERKIMVWIMTSLLSSSKASYLILTSW